MPGYYSASAGQVITAANWNSYVRDQTVNVFANAAARTSAIPTPSDGMMSYLQDINRPEVSVNGNWCRFPGSIVHSNAAAVNVTTLDNARRNVWTYTWTPQHGGYYRIETITPTDGVAGEEAKFWFVLNGTDNNHSMERMFAGAQVSTVYISSVTRFAAANTSPVTIAVDAQRSSGGSFFNARANNRIITITYEGQDLS